MKSILKTETEYSSQPLVGFYFYTSCQFCDRTLYPEEYAMNTDDHKISNAKKNYILFMHSVHSKKRSVYSGIAEFMFVCLGKAFHQAIVCSQVRTIYSRTW